MTTLDLKVYKKILDKENREMLKNKKIKMRAEIENNKKQAKLKANSEKIFKKMQQAKEDEVKKIAAKIAKMSLHGKG